MPKPRTRRLILVVLGLVGISFGLLIYKRTRTPGADTLVHPGETLFAILPSIVTQIDFETPNRHLVATRSDSSRPFSIVVADMAGAVVERCEGRAAFGRVFEAITAIRAKRGLKRAEGDALHRQHEGRLSKLRIQNTTAIEALEWEIIVTDAPERRVVAFDGQYAFELDLPAALLDKLATGCSSL